MKLENYNICPECGEKLIVGDHEFEPVGFEWETVLGCRADCPKCGWEGWILWEYPKYLETVDESSLDD